MTKIKKTHLENISIERLFDQKLKPYYLIKNENEVDEVYFCFADATKKGWQDLVQDWEFIKKVKLEYEKTDKGNIVLECLIEVYSSDY